MRLYTPICSKIPAIWWRGLHIGSAQHRSHPASRSDAFAGERSHGNGFPSSDHVRLLQPFLAHPQEGWWSKTHPRSQTSVSCPYETAVQDDYIETVRLLSHPDSRPPQAVFEICLRGSSLSIHGPSLWAVSGSLYFYEVHGCGFFPAETDGNPHLELP